MQFALNHMTCPNLGYEALLDLAKSLDCVGVEVRNDIARPLFDGIVPEEAGKLAQDRGLRLVGLSQVYPFNVWSEQTARAVRDLVAIAKAAGAETISLIPRNDGLGTANGERQANLRIALKAILPIIQTEDIVALVEPLGFARSSLREKSELVDILADIGGMKDFRIVHDTFHHVLAGGGRLYPELTGIVHISAVVDPALMVRDMEDEHRVLVDERDRLGNIQQIAGLRDAGYEGVFSYECFSPEIHAIEAPYEPLKRSFDFIRGQVHAAAG